MLEASNNATAAAQRILDSSRRRRPGVAAEPHELDASRTVQSVSGSTAIAFFREPDQDARAASPRPTGGAPRLGGDVITPELRERVQANPGGQYWQSVALENADGGTDPGVVVGSDLEVPPAPAATSSTSATTSPKLQQTARLHAGRPASSARSRCSRCSARSPSSSCAWVIEPIRSAAATSRRLAAGDLGVRMPREGEDELATLAASFNGMADSLQARIRELAELSVMQQRFVSDVSHELRTPLTTIRLAGDVLYGQRDDFPGPTSRTVELLHTQTDRFEMLLADLLEISRYDAGSVELATEPTNLVHLAGDAIESMHELARERGSELRLVAPGGHLDAEVDPRRIRRIVRNLLGNAIEHGEGRPIVVAVDSNATRHRALGARLRPRHDRRGDGARVRPVLACRSESHAHHRRHRASGSRSRSKTPSRTAARSTSGRGRARAPCSASRCRARARMPRPSSRRCRSSPTTSAPTGPPPTGAVGGGRPSPIDDRARREVARCVARRLASRHPSPSSAARCCSRAARRIPSSGPVQPGDPAPVEESLDLDIVVERTDRPMRRRSRSSRASSRPRRARATTTRWRGEYLTPTFADEWQAERRRHDRRARRSRARAWSTRRRCVVDATPAASLSATTGSTRCPSPRTPIAARLPVRAGRRAVAHLERAAGHPDRRDRPSRRSSASYTLYFFDPTYRYLVPDLRWFAGRDSAQTSIVQRAARRARRVARAGRRVGVPRGRAARARRRARGGRRRERRRSRAPRSTTSPRCSACRRSSTRASSAVRNIDSVALSLERRRAGRAAARAAAR